ncbi:MAG TPA: SigB/SigF/SigG family RNA polymerase sigma factor [Actinopolymorphaceae bacterium]
MHAANAAHELVLQHLDLARKLAARYSGRGQPLDELTQVAMLGLVQAANRFDPERGTNFVSYAIPTILGELRRYFRDQCWAVRIPRPLHDLYHASTAAQERLSAQLGRSPTAREVAADLDVPEEDVLHALESGSAYSALSLDAPAPNADDNADNARPLAESIGDDDETLDRIEQREAVRQILATVPHRERRILVLWFFGNRTQTQIAEELGISQMHVSRLLASTLARIRTAVLDPGGEPIHWPTPRQRRAS